MNTECQNVPIVMLHGFGAGIGFWSLNLDEFANDHPVYAIDLLGFGRSSRPSFSKSAPEIERQLVMFVEKWREKMNLQSMILLGHSFGGFISTLYTMQYPEFVEHLILGDPWGFNPVPNLKEYSLWEQSLIRLENKVSPLWIVRVVGPWGPLLLRKGRPDIMEKFEGAVENHDKTVAKYIFHCNTKKKTGELAFSRLVKIGVFPRNPLCDRVVNGIREYIPMTFIFGSESYLDSSYGPKIKEARHKSYTHIEHVENAGHQVFSDNASDFNRFVINACKILKSHHV